MAKRQLNQYVTVGGATYGPLDDVPDDVAERITNPAVWLSDKEAAEAEEEAAGWRPPGTSSGHVLAAHVTVGGVTYGPADPVPDDVAERITNPAAWADGKGPHRLAGKAEASKDEPKADPKDEPKAARKTANPAAK